MSARICKSLSVFVLLLVAFSSSGIAANGFDLGGRTVTFFSPNSIHEPFEEGPGYGWLQTVEETFNCKIEFVQSSGRDDFVDKVILGGIAGDPPGDIFFSWDEQMVPLARQGFILPLNDYLDDAYYQRLTHIHRDTLSLYGSIGEVQYGFSSNDTYQPERDVWSINAIAYNKELLAEAGLPDPYELQVAGEWTYDAFLDIAINATRDTTGDGEIDQWGFGFYKFDGFVSSNNAAWTRTIDGREVVAVTEPEFIEAWQLWYDVIHVHNASAPGDGTEVRGRYVEGNVAMIFGDQHSLSISTGQDSRFPGQQIDVGWVFFPKGPNAEDYSAMVDFIHLFSLPATSDEPEAMIELASMLFRTTQEYLSVPLDQYEAYLLDSFALVYDVGRDALESHRTMLQNWLPTPYFRAVLANSGAWGTGSSIVRRGANPLQAWSEIAPALQAALDEFLGQ